VIVVAVRWYLRYGLSYRDVEELLAERGVEVDETYVKVAGVWRYVYRAIDQYGQVIDVLMSARRDAVTARRFFTRALTTLKTAPVEVVTDAAPVYPAVLSDLVPAAWHHVERYANNPVEADHGQLKHRLRPMRGLRTDRTAQTVMTGHAFVQNLRRGHYEIATETPTRLRLVAAFAELAKAI
jgi:IS6 family transposase